MRVPRGPVDGSRCRASGHRGPNSANVRSPAPTGTGRRYLSYVTLAGARVKPLDRRDVGIPRVALRLSPWRRRWSAYRASSRGTARPGCGRAGPTGAGPRPCTGSPIRGSGKTRQPVRPVIQEFGFVGVEPDDRRDTGYWRSATTDACDRLSWSGGARAAKPGVLGRGGQRLGNTRRPRVARSMEEEKR